MLLQPEQPFSSQFLTDPNMNNNQEAPPDYFDLDAWEAYQSRQWFARAATNLAVIARVAMFGLLLTSLGTTESRKLLGVLFAIAGRAGPLGAPGASPLINYEAMSDSGLYIWVGTVLFGTVMGLWLMARDDRENVAVQRTFVGVLNSLVLFPGLWYMLKLGMWIRNMVW